MDGFDWTLAAAWFARIASGIWALVSVASCALHPVPTIADCAMVTLSDSHDVATIRCVGAERIVRQTEDYVEIWCSCVPPGLGYPLGETPAGEGNGEWSHPVE